MVTVVVLEREQVVALAERERAAREKHAEAVALMERAQEMIADAHRTRRNPLFVGRCYLCGGRINKRSLFCVEHAWAAGIA